LKSKTIGLIKLESKLELTYLEKLNEKLSEKEGEKSLLDF